MNKRFSVAPSLDDLETMARAAFTTIPEILTQHLGSVIFRIDEFPDEETVREMGLESPFGLLGLYRGVALTDKSVLSTPVDVDMIFLYRRPILEYWCASAEDLYHLIRHVLIHEIGHHFGFSDGDMEHIEALCTSPEGDEA